MLRGQGSFVESLRLGEVTLAFVVPLQQRGAATQRIERSCRLHSLPRREAAVVGEQGLECFGRSIVLVRPEQSLCLDPTRSHEGLRPCRKPHLGQALACFRQRLQSRRVLSVDGGGQTPSLQGKPVGCGVLTGRHGLSRLVGSL